MFNPELKKMLCDTGQFDAFCVERRLHGLNKQLNLLEDPNQYCLSKEEFVACKQLANCKRNQRSKIKKIVSKGFKEGYIVYFATFTFNDKSLNKKQRTRRNYVTNMLKDNTLDYIATIDFSDKEREHYHALFVVNKNFKFNRNNNGELYCDGLLKYKKNYGIYKIKQVINTEVNLCKVSNYIVKKKTLSVAYKHTRLITKKIDRNIPYVLREEVNDDNEKQRTGYM